MKRIINVITVFALIFALAVSATACSKVDPWKSAAHTEDTTLGEGASTIYVQVKVNDNSVTFTVNTDKTVLGDALLELGIIDGDVEDYGLYVKYANGIRADYDKDKAYWAFYENGEYLMTGVDSTDITNGGHYEIVYSK